MSHKRFASVWDAIEDTPQESASLAARSALMIELVEFIKRHDLRQSQAAKIFGVTQPRMSDLVRGKINLFSLDTLMDMAAAGLKPRLTVSAPTSRKPRVSIARMSSGIVH